MNVQVAQKCHHYHLLDRSLIVKKAVVSKGKSSSKGSVAGIPKMPKGFKGSTDNIRYSVAKKAGPRNLEGEFKASLKKSGC